MTRAKLLRKIAKLKALSECKTGNPNELAVAAAAMSKLMIEHGIGPHELSVDDYGLTAWELRPPEGHVFEKWHAALLAGLSQVHACKMIANRLRCSEEKYAVLQVVGSTDNVDNVKQLSQYLIVEIYRLCEEWCQRHEAGPVPQASLAFSSLEWHWGSITQSGTSYDFRGLLTGDRRPSPSRQADYCFGIVCAVKDKLDRAKVEVERNLRSCSDERGLAIIDGAVAKLEEQIAAHLPELNDLPSNQIARKGLDPRSFRDGQLAGNRLDLAGSGTKAIANTIANGNTE